MKKHEITIAEVKEKVSNGVCTFLKKDNSPRGCKCVPADEIKIGDEIVIDNYFHTVIQ